MPLPRPTEVGLEESGSSGQTFLRLQLSEAYCQKCSNSHGLERNLRSIFTLTFFFSNHLNHFFENVKLFVCFSVFGLFLTWRPAKLLS